MKTSTLHSLTVLTIALLAATCLFGCKENQTGPEDTSNLLSPDNLADVTITVTGYDRVTVGHPLGNPLRTKAVTSLYLGYSDTTGLKMLDSAFSSSIMESEPLELSLPVEVRLDSSWISPTLILRFVLSDGTIADIKRTVDLFAFPYQTTQFVVGMDALDEITGPGAIPQDVTRLGSVLYVHPFAAYGMFSINLENGVASELVLYGGGDHIAADSIFVFCEASSSIKRYNTTLGTVDLEFPVQSDRRPIGMDTYNGKLYAQGPDTLWEYRYDGTIVGGRPFIMRGYYMSISKGIIYTMGYSPFVLRAYDLSTLQMVAEYEEPFAKGIKIIGDTLYFCDFFKRSVCKLALADLRLYSPID